MPAFIRELLHGQSTKARSLRSAAFVVIGFGGQNLLRLGSNLILTRLLFPEAFGLMALVQVFLIGVQMFSDVGINTSIIRDERGEDQDFLDTAWTIQVLRGLLLWVICCLIAWPAAQIYDEPMLLQLLPASGLSALILGFNTTRVAVANRNLQIGVQTMTVLGAQAVTLVATIALTFLWPNVWALVIGNLIGAVIRVVAQQILLPGPRNRFRWDPSAVHSILHFGKYIFLSSIAGFLANQGDRAILGVYVPLADLGIYTVGFMLASMPLLLVQAAGGKIVTPLYRKYPTTADPANRRKIAKVRRLLLLSALGVTGIFALFSVPIIHLLYDDRYVLAGPVMVLVCLSSVPQISAASYNGAFLAQGDSRSHFQLITLAAIFQIGLLLYGVPHFGLAGAALASGISVLLLHPFRIRVLRRYQAWDAATDLLTMGFGFVTTGLACWIWRDQIALLLAR